MVEMVVCTVLLSVVTAVLAPGLYAVHQQRKLTRYDTHTLLELNNLAAKATQEVPSTLELSSWFADRYGAATLQVENIDADGASAGQQPIRLTIVRTLAEERPAIEHSLTIWKTVDASADEEASE